VTRQCATRLPQGSRHGCWNPATARTYPTNGPVDDLPRTRRRNGGELVAALAREHRMKESRDADEDRTRDQDDTQERATDHAVHGGAHCRSSASRTATAAWMSARCVNARGKFPSSSPESVTPGCSVRGRTRTPLALSVALSRPRSWRRVQDKQNALGGWRSTYASLNHQSPVVLLAGRIAAIARST
jgi:hypothetical protein